MNIHRKIGRAAKRLERLFTERFPRCWLAHPDVCLYMRQYPQFGWRYLIKLSAKRGHLVLWFGWLGATVRW